MSANLTNSLKQKIIVLVAAIILAVTGYVAYKASNNNDLKTNEFSTEDLNQDSSDQNSRSIATASDSYEQCKSRSLPSFINVSLTWSGQLFGEALKQLSPPSVVVVAAGNDHPDPLPQEKVKISQDLDAIVVGSLAPDGKRSRFSQEHPEVHIMAPSDYYQISADENGNRVSFGGTSAAAPLVTGSLAGFEWLSGYHPTAEEAKILLAKTAIPHEYSHDKPPTNGVGILNSYKLGMVGKKLKELCGTDISCFKEKIKEDSSYDFPEDQGLIEAVKLAFPECSPDHCNVEFFICTDKAKVFKRLRKAAFLNPSDKQLWKYVACAYNSSGFSKNREGVLSIYKSLFGPLKENKETHTFCHMSADCSLIPASGCNVNTASNTRPFLAVTSAESEIYHTENQCLPNSLCNKKCRCGNKEKVNVVKGDLKANLFSSQCVNSRCVLSSSVIADPSDREEAVTPEGEEAVTSDEEVVTPNSLPGAASGQR